MTSHEYDAARDALGWTHERLAEVIGVSRRTSYRYQSGATEIPGPAARLIRHLVLLHLTTSRRKFNDLIAELRAP